MTLDSLISEMFRVWKNRRKGEKRYIYQETYRGIVRGGYIRTSKDPRRYNKFEREAYFKDPTVKPKLVAILHANGGVEYL